eukprot:2313003-Rhodomonas_salina.1
MRALARSLPLFPYKTNLPAYTNSATRLRTPSDLSTTALRQRRALPMNALCKVRYLPMPNVVPAYANCGIFLCQLWYLSTPSVASAYVRATPCAVLTYAVLTYA